MMGPIGFRPPIRFLLVWAAIGMVFGVWKLVEILLWIVSHVRWV